MHCIEKSYNKTVASLSIVASCYCTENARYVFTSNMLVYSVIGSIQTAKSGIHPVLICKQS